MNKIVHINLGGFPFTMDENAHQRLEIYLANIQNYFKAEVGGDEIVRDIEVRLAEIFKAKKGQFILTLDDVVETITLMGTPEELGMTDEATFEYSTTASAASFKTGKRLFRDERDKVVAGVASGLSAYLGIEDPIWLRIAFLLATFAAGFGLPLYIILWIVMPIAKTSADRLAMRGEKINVQNIAKNVKQEIEQLGRQLNGLKDEIKGEFKSTKRRNF